MLDEALRGHGVSHDGEHIRLSGAVFRPGPTQSPYASRAYRVRSKTWFTADRL